MEGDGGWRRFGEEGKRLLIETTEFQAAIQTEGYVSGVAEGSFVDRKTGTRDAGYGLLIADFLLEPGADLPDTPPDHRYPYNDRYHGNIAKRYVALPQICTQAKSLPHEITRGPGFISVRQWYTWNIACPPYHAGSKWEQHLLFPDGKRWFLGWDRFACADDFSMCLYANGHAGSYQTSWRRRLSAGLSELPWCNSPARVSSKFPARREVSLPPQRHKGC